MLEGHYLLYTLLLTIMVQLFYVGKLNCYAFLLLQKKRHEMKNKQSLRKQSVLLQHIYLLLLSTLLI